MMGGRVGAMVSWWWGMSGKLGKGRAGRVMKKFNKGGAWRIGG